MLACRIPYFATLLTSDFTDKSEDLSLEVCNSDIFKKILDFVWEGEIQLSDMHLGTILNLLEIARFLCIDMLVDGVEEYVINQFDWKNIDFVSSLYALDFSTSHSFQKISDFLLRYVHQYIEEISSLPEFQSVSTTSIMKFLRMKEGRATTEISVLKALLKWLEGNVEISEASKEEMANTFDLENFTNSDMEMLEKSSLFNERQLLHLVRSRLLELEETVVANEETIVANEETIAANEIVIKNLQPTTRIALTFGWDYDAPYTYKSVWVMDKRRIINCVEFDLVNDGKYRNKVKVECCINGLWSKIGEFNVGVSGHQVVAFQRKEVEYVSIILTKKTGCILSKYDLSNVLVAFM